MGEDNRKRKHTQYEEDDDQSSNLEVAATTAALRNPEPWTKEASMFPSGSLERNSAGRNSDEYGWTKVSKGSRKRHNKRLKKEHDARQAEHVAKPMQTERVGKKKGNYPAVTYAALHTMLRSIKLSDLQSLLLYCLADGTAPQWLSVRHHGQIRKAVILLVPGLEKGMFDGSIALPDLKPQDTNAEKPSGADGVPSEDPNIEDASHVASLKASHDTLRSFTGIDSPDDFVPLRLSVEKLPTSLHPLAEMFEHLWPVKAPGDEKFHKVHSPVHAMLTSPIPKSQEEREATRNVRGPKPVTASKSWENKPTAITTFIASKEDLLENEYILHPAASSTVADKKAYLAQREGAKQSLEDGWVDTKIDKLEDADVADYQKGSLAAGRTILAMDCEMCLVEGGESALTRISLLGWDGTVVMDELVKPSKPIIDYLTP